MERQYTTKATRSRKNEFDRFLPILPGVFPFLLVSLVAAVSAALVSTRPPEQPAPAPAALPQVEAKIESEGRDSENRRMAFVVYVLSDRFSWSFESATALESEANLMSPELVAAINRAQEVFCVGMASSEGERRKEEERAGRRAANLARWVIRMIPDAGAIRVLTMNAGQYRGTEELSSSGQRRAVIVAADPHDPAINLREALRSGFEAKQQQYPIFHMLLHHYSLSDHGRFALMIERTRAACYGVWVLLERLRLLTAVLSNCCDARSR